MDTEEITLVGIERAVERNDVRMLAKYSKTLYVALLRAMIQVKKLEK